MGYWALIALKSNNHIYYWFQWGEVLSRQCRRACHLLLITCSLIRSMRLSLIVLVLFCEKKRSHTLAITSIFITASKKKNIVRQMMDAETHRQRRRNEEETKKKQHKDNQWFLIASLLLECEKTIIYTFIDWKVAIEINTH